MFARYAAKAAAGTVRAAAFSTTARAAGSSSSSSKWLMATAAGVGGVTLLAVNNSSNVAFADERPAVDYTAVRKDLAALMDDENVKNPSVDDGVQGGGGYVHPMLLRLAWHSSGTWSEKEKNGGSEGGTMRFSPESDHGGNAGLHIARNLLEPIKAKHPGITYADLYILSGVVAVAEMGGPDIPFRPGRSDAEKVPEKFEDDSRFSHDGRLPDAALGAQHLRDIFYRMGFNDQEIVALSGAHAVGRCHTDRSGFWGPWTRAENTFSNEYFRLLLEEKWTPKRTHKGKKWRGPEQLEDPSGELMMLPTDMALVKDEKFKKWVEIYAKDEARFFKDFSKAYQRLNELGCTGLKSNKPWYQFW